MQLHGRILYKQSLSLNSMVQSHTRNGLFEQALDLYYLMLRTGGHGDNFTFPSVAKACAKLGSLRDGKRIHANVILMGFQRDVFVQTALMDMYSKCGNISSARHLFDEMPVRVLVSWNSMISGYCREFHLDKSFKLLNQMQDLGMTPNSSTLVSLVSGCSCSDCVHQGLAIHCYIIKLGYDSNLPLLNSVINMYVRFDLIDAARSLFDSMAGRSTVSWTAIIGGYVKVGDFNQAFDLFNQMQHEQVNPDSITFINLVSACAQIERILVGSSVHASIIKNGCCNGEPVVNSLVAMYTRCHNLRSARKLFDLVPKKTLFLWTSMITGYINNHHPSEALILFQNLLQTNVKPNEVTISSALLACADLGYLSMGEKIEEYASSNWFGLELDIRVRTSLIHMYCKCGRLERAREIFDRVSNKDLAVWSSMIAGYAIHGKGGEALALFSQMKGCGIKPDDVVFTSVLSACGHSGLIKDGLHCFLSMQRDFNIQPRIEHYSCLVDLLGRAGHLNLAWETIQEMPIRADATVWAPFLSSCRTHSNVDLGEFAAKHLFELEPWNTRNYILMANIYAFAGKWEEAEEVRRLMKDRGLVKEPGWSKIEVDGSFHVFLVGDRSHYQTNEIYEKLEDLTRKMRQAGYVAEVQMEIRVIEAEY